MGGKRDEHPRDKVAKLVSKALDQTGESQRVIARSILTPGTSQAQLNKLANGTLYRISWPALHAFATRLALDTDEVLQLWAAWDADPGPDWRSVTAR